MSRNIMIISGNGGVGKTTITMGLGISLAKQRQKVLLVDCDFFLNNLNILFGKNNIAFDLCDVLNQRCRISQAIYCHKTIQNLFLLPNIKAQINQNYDETIFGDQLKELFFSFDYILFDCPVAVQKGFFMALGQSSEAICVVTPEESSIIAANKVLSIINSKVNMKIVVNKQKFDLASKNKLLKAWQIEKALKLPVVGTVEFCDEISSFFKKQTTKELKNISDEFLLLSQNVLLGQHAVYEPQTGFFNKIKKFFKRR